MAVWVETRLGISFSDDDQRWVRAKPKTITEAVDELSADAGRPAADCRKVLRDFLLVSSLPERNRISGPEASEHSFFAFKLHQFVSGDWPPAFDDRATRRTQGHSRWPAVPPQVMRTSASTLCTSAREWWARVPPGTAGPGHGDRASLPRTRHRRRAANARRVRNRRRAGCRGVRLPNVRSSQRSRLHIRRPGRRVPRNLAGFRCQRSSAAEAVLPRCAPAALPRRAGWPHRRGDGGLVPTG